MAGGQGHLDDATLLSRPTAELGRLGGRAQLLALVGLALSVIGFFVVRDAFWQSYLIAYIFWIGITLGSLAVLMVQYLSGGAWGLVSRRILEASVRTLPLMAVLFVPIWLKRQTLYLWTRPEAAADELIHQKAAYLNVPFFTVRAVLLFVIWGTLAYLLTKWSKDQDELPAQPPGPADAKFRVLSGPGLVIYVITITFMSVDWVMSLDPHWYSTIFGILTIGGQGLATMAFTIFILARLIQFEPMRHVAVAENFHDLGKLMFAFTLLWAYFSVSQLLIIWSANLPEEIPFYLERLHGPWYPVSVAVLLGQFVLPFGFLLSRNLKRNPRTVSRIALFVLFMRIIDITWTIGPVFRHEGSALSLVDFAVVLGMGGIWLWWFFRNLADRALVPAKDPYFKEAMAHGGH
jgi:hypothetical protein